MKRIEFRPVLSIVIFLAAILLQSCTAKDTTIKADLVAKAKSEKDFAGVRFTVDKGIVTLGGECATEKSKSTVETTVRGTYGVKDVVNNISIAPVVIGIDQQLKQGIDSLLRDYPGIEAITKDSMVYLQGKLADDKVQKLKNEVNSLKPKMLDARLTSR